MFSRILDYVDKFLSWFEEWTLYLAVMIGLALHHGLKAREAILLKDIHSLSQEIKAKEALYGKMGIIEFTQNQGREKTGVRPGKVPLRSRSSCRTFTSHAKGYPAGFL